MPVIADTAYPRLPANPGPTELEAFTPETGETAFARQRTRQPGPRLALLVLLKTFQRLGYIAQLADMPAVIVAHVAACADLTGAVQDIAGYDDTTYRVRLAALVRGYVGVTGYDREGADWPPGRVSKLRAAATIWLTSSTPASKNCCVAAASCPPSAHSFDSRAAPEPWSTAATTANSPRPCWPKCANAWPPCSWCRRAQPGPAGTRSRLIHRGPARSACASTWGYLAWLREQAVADAVFAGVPDRKLRQFAAEARSLGAADLGRTVESKRLTLMAALLRSQIAQALDDAAEMFVRLTTRMHNRAKEALEEHRARHAAETDALVALLRETVLACQDQEAGPDGRLATVEGLLLPDADAILAKCEAHAAFAGNNYLPLLTRYYGGQRVAFLHFLTHAAPVSTSQDRAIELAITFLLAHRGPWSKRWRPMAPPFTGHSICPGWARSGGRC